MRIYYLNTDIHPQDLFTIIYKNVFVALVLSMHFCCCATSNNNTIQLTPNLFIHNH